jgi:hypothetical protein
MNTVFWFWGFRNRCGSHLLTHDSEDGIDSGFHIVSKFTSHTMQKPQNQKTIFQAAT